MYTRQQLAALLQKIQGRGYPAYKQIKGQYDFGSYILSIDHVQSDPFAAPSAVSIVVLNPGFPARYLENTWTRTAVEDAVLRHFSRALRHFRLRKGSGNSGKVSISHPVQEILPRTACRFMADGALKICLKIMTEDLIDIFFKDLPETIARQLIYPDLTPEEKAEYACVYDLALDQHWIRKELENRKLAAFIANGSILPRESGASDLPMKNAVPFQSPSSLELTLQLPSGKSITGMAIPDGITVIVGGGYHGKSTLLEAVESGVYDHIAGDGREYVITKSDAVKVRAEDGRSVHQTDISEFIHNLPGGRSTEQFVSEDASGSTSQAAGVTEALESGSRLLLMDEDTSATNFMIRDDLMAEVVHPEQEPIVPFIARIEAMKKSGISTILAAGSSGAYFHCADLVVQMDQYRPADITARARKAADRYPLHLSLEQFFSKPSVRIPLPNPALEKGQVKVKTSGLDTVMIAREPIDIRYVEQFKDPEQAAAIGRMLVYAQRNLIDGRQGLDKVINTLEDLMDQNPDLFGRDLARPRRQEIFAAFSRWRSQYFCQDKSNK